MPLKRTSLDALCEYHNRDGDERGWDIKHFGGPEVSCPCCRAEGTIPKTKLEAFFKEAEENDRAYSEVRQENGTFHIYRKSPMGVSQPHFLVELVSGSWPSDDDLVRMCDSYCPFGGGVRKISDNKAEVTRWTDD